MSGIGNFFSSPFNIVLIVAAVIAYLIIVSRRKRK